MGSDLRNIGIAFNKASHARHDEWLKSSKNAEQHLGYRTLGDIYQVAKTGFQPAIANSSSTQAESNVNASDCDHVSPEKNTDTEESGSVSTASKSDGSSDSDDDLVLSPGQDCVGVARIRTEELKRWMLKVEAQRQIIQNREYWNMANSYNY